MPEEEKRITVRVPYSLHLRVKVKAALMGKTVSDVLREYLEQLASDVEPLAKETGETPKNK